MNKSVANYLIDYGNRFPNREAIVDEGGTWTYFDLAHRMQSAAAALLEAGLQPGQRVTFFGYPGLAYAETLCACISAGFVYVGLNPKYTAKELHYVLGHADVALVVFDARCSVNERTALEEACRFNLSQSPPRVEWIDSLARSCRGLMFANKQQTLTLPFPIVAHDAAAIVYTSGTTGQPKGAVIRNSSLAHEGILFTQRFLNGDVSRVTRVLSNLPVNHIGCIGDLTCAWLVMAATVVFQARFEPCEIGKVLVREKITFYFQVPAMFQLALSQGLELSELAHLTHIGWGGAPCPRSLVEQFSQLNVSLCNTYGLSEGTGTSTVTRDDASIDALANSVGVALEDGTVRLSEEGEIQLKGDLLFAGYLNDESATRRSFTADGWFCTGDIGELDGAGNIALKGRLKEMFKSGGYNVYPREVEVAIEAIEGVELAAVIAKSDPVWTEVGHAFVMVSDSSMLNTLTPEKLSETLRKTLANYKIPKRFTVALDLPRLPVGKIDKQALRNL
jgi:acyl-CoA synthetase (AMP-forming)/AMP-acid ligase II